MPQDNFREHSSVIDSGSIRHPLARRVTFPNDPPQDPTQLPSLYHKRIKDPSFPFDPASTPRPRSIPAPPLRAPSPYPRMKTRWGSALLDSFRSDAADGDEQYIGWGWNLLSFTYIAIHSLFAITHGSNSQPDRAFLGRSVLTDNDQDFSCGEIAGSFLLRLAFAIIHTYALNHMSSTIAHKHPARAGKIYLLLSLTGPTVIQIADKTWPEAWTAPLATLAYSLLMRSNSLRTAFRNTMKLCGGLILIFACAWCQDAHSGTSNTLTANSETHARFGAASRCFCTFASPLLLMIAAQGLARLWATSIRFSRGSKGREDETQNKAETLIFPRLCSQIAVVFLLVLNWIFWRCMTLRMGDT